MEFKGMDQLRLPLGLTGWIRLVEEKELIERIPILSVSAHGKIKSAEREPLQVLARSEYNIVTSSKIEA